MWKNILLHTAPESVPGASAAATYAVSLAGHLQADLTALGFACHIPTPFGLRTGINRSAIDQQQVVLRQSTEKSIAATKDLSDKASVNFDDRIETCLAVDAGHVFAQYARLHDATVVGAGNDDSGENRNILQAALFQSGRPIIIVPEESATEFACGTVAVAWNDSPQSARALSDAMPLIEQAKAVHIISVTDDDTLRAIMPSIEVAKYLARHGVQATVSDTIADSKSVHQAIAAKAQAVGAQLLVMGAYGHSRLREQILGGTTHGFINDCPLPVLMAH